MPGVQVISGLDPSTYSVSPLHAPDLVWVEKNCYVDVWIELLHALHLEPRAMLAFTVAVDFEGDQWTFFKPPHGELRELYGIDVQEMTVWRSLIEHAEEHLAAGKLISTEADAFWLPDTAGTDYRRQHTKSTIILNELQPAEGRLGYFHNAGYFSLQGEDFRRTFRLGAAPDPDFMPLFAELIRLDALVRRSGPELSACAAALWRRHLGRRPRTNPLRRFEERYRADLPDIISRGLPYYHAWAFASIRQIGAAFELAAHGLRWLDQHGAAAVAGAAADFETISKACKTLILKGARAVNSRKPNAGFELLEEMAGCWDRALALLETALPP